jgi:hypothetical protein
MRDPHEPNIAVVRYLARISDKPPPLEQIEERRADTPLRAMESRLASAPYLWAIATRSAVEGRGQPGHVPITP